MKISLIIPVFNVAPYLRACLDSVLSQTYPGWECVCVDDGSTDESGKILDDYATRDVRFRVFHQKNAGVSAARNFGLDQSIGDWILFIDSDDKIMPQTLAKIADAVNGNACEMVTFEMCRVKDFDESIPSQLESCGAIYDMERKEDAAAFIQKIFPNRLWVWNKCFNRSLIGNLRFESYQPCEDAVLSLSCILRAKRIIELPDVLYKYLQHPGSCLAGVTPKRVMGDINGMRRLTEVISGWRFVQEIKSHVRHVMRKQFLPGITRNMQLLFGRNQITVALQQMYAESVRYVFVESSLYDFGHRLVYRTYFGGCSPDDVRKSLKLFEKVGNIVKLPRRIICKVGRMIIRG